MLEGSTCYDSLTTMTTKTTMTTPSTKVCRSDDSIILLGWSVTLLNPSQYPRYTCAVKDGRPWVAQATDKAAKHNRNTAGTRSTPKLSHQFASELTQDEFTAPYTVLIPAG